MSCSGLPIECETWEEACSCATSIAETHGFVLRETTGPEHEGPLRIPKVPWPLSAEGWVSPKVVLRYSDRSDRIRLVVQVFPANSYREELCYAFQGDVERLEADSSITAVLSAHGWRKTPSYFEDDVQSMLCNLLYYDASGRVLARVLSWNKEKACGVIKVFLHPGEIQEGVQPRVYSLDAWWTLSLVTSSNVKLQDVKFHRGWPPHYKRDVITAEGASGIAQSFLEFSAPDGSRFKIEPRIAREYASRCASLDIAGGDPVPRAEVREGQLLRVPLEWTYQKHQTRDGGEKVCRAYDAVLADKSPLSKAG